MEKETLDYVYETLSTMDNVLRDTAPSDGTKLYWIGRAVTEMAQRLRPICEPDRAA